MVGFVAGLPFMDPMVERAWQIEVPKDPKPRTDKPKLTVGHGGCFGCISRCAGRANGLVDNDEGAAALECLFMGPELLFTADALVAVTGAKLTPRIDGAAQPT